SPIRTGSPQCHATPRLPIYGLAKSAGNSEYLIQNRLIKTFNPSCLFRRFGNSRNAGNVGERYETSSGRRGSCQSEASPRRVRISSAGGDLDGGEQGGMV